MKKREEVTRETVIGVIWFLFISCIYGGYLYIVKDVPLIEIIREIVVFTIAVTGVSFLGLFTFFLLACVWVKIIKRK